MKTQIRYLQFQHSLLLNFLSPISPTILLLFLSCPIFPCALVPLELTPQLVQIELATPVPIQHIENIVDVLLSDVQLEVVNDLSELRKVHLFVVVGVQKLEKSN
jgi:hypothetical protein